MTALTLVWWQIVVIFLVTVTAFYLYVLRVYSHWERKGVEYFEPAFLWGNVRPALCKKVDIGTLFKDLHLRIKSRYAGFYLCLRPAILVRDPELIKQILVTDFDHFMDRGVYVDPVKDPVGGHLYSLSGDKWHNLRHKMMPVFTSEKVKVMYGTIYDIGMTLQGYVGQIADSDPNNQLDIRDLCARYLTDVIASVAFGIEVDSIHEPTTYFRKMGAKVMDWNTTAHKVLLLSVLAPKLVQIFKLKLVDDDVEEFLIETVRRTLQYREKHKISRDDFMQLLIQMRTSDDVNTEENFKGVNHMTIEECAAQVYILIVAAYATSSSLMTFCLYELSKNPTLQREVQEDIDRALNKHNWRITHECIKDMAFLGRCIEETMRMYPPIAFLARICTKTYMIPESNVTIEKGTNVFVSIYGVQNDPALYPDPSIFKPSRFMPEEKAKRPTMNFLSMGQGPRGCIANEYGFLTAATGLAALLSKFDFRVVGPVTPELVMNPNTFLLIENDGIHLNLSRRVFKN